MSNPLDALIPSSDDGRVPTYRFATVTGIDPLRIRLDGEEEAVAATPSTITAPAVGDRVLVLHRNLQMIVLGRVGGELDKVLAFKAASSLQGTIGVVQLRVGQAYFHLGTNSLNLGMPSSATQPCLRFFTNGDWLLGHEGSGGGHFYWTNNSERITARGVGFRVEPRVGNGILEIYEPPTSTFAANVGIANTPKDRIYKLTSARRYKVDIEDADVGRAPRILDVQPRTWYDRTQVERKIGADQVEDTPAGPRISPQARRALLTYTDALDLDGDGLPDPPLRRIPGLVAEEVRDAGLDEYVTYDVHGNIEGIAYDRLWTTLIPVVRDQRNRIEALEAYTAALEARLAALEARIDSYEE